MKARKAATDKKNKRALDKNANVSVNPPISTVTPHLSKDKDAMPESRSISRNSMPFIEGGKGKLAPRGRLYIR